ncbi:phage tail protein [Longispora fulva]|uniref:Phage tail-like protein n=1 Tax=Longispora fulva TaxID=619741 RepID=A0A8J7GL93_9ACTN|nr:phage tail protein [Longispora fulva]MBG6141714.1 phage tail-like protein [Longispora fulva]GIG59131.1 phage tail protein [Longispora fulva]
MRLGLDHLTTAHPIGERLPGVYLENAFTQRFTEALDQVLAPVFLALDCFPAYLDPALVPEDFLDWLAGWVALSLDESWPVAQRRDLVAHAVELHRWRGTKRGLAAHVRLLTGGAVEVVDSGVCGWSDLPGGEVPGSGPAQVVVRVGVPDPGQVNERRLRAAIVEAVPAHVLVTLEVVAS